MDLIQKTIVFRYDLPCSSPNISKTIYSTESDKCYCVHDNSSIITIIYNSIVEYSFNEFELTRTDFENLHSVALRTKLKYNFDADEETKIKYGFFGEVLLFSVLLTQFQAKPLIARGYFYNPLENSETKGFDSYQLVERNGTTELWFGESKFHIEHSSCIKSVFDNIEKALSDQYLEKNVLAISNQRNNLNISGSKIEKIINDWENNPNLKIAEEVKKHSMKLVYPILLLYEADEKGFDDSIKKIPEYIKSHYPSKTISLTIDYSIFFILIPLNHVRQVKTTVIQWIECKMPLIS